MYTQYICLCNPFYKLNPLEKLFFCNTFVPKHCECCLCHLANANPNRKNQIAFYLKNYHLKCLWVDILDTWTGATLTKNNKIFVCHFIHIMPHLTSHVELCINDTHEVSFWTCTLPNAMNDTFKTIKQMDRRTNERTDRYPASVVISCKSLCFSFKYCNIALQKTAGQTCNHRDNLMQFKIVKFVFAKQENKHIQIANK